MSNAFGVEIPDYKEILSDIDVENAVEKMLSDLMRYIGAKPEVSDRIIGIAKSYKSVDQYETDAHRLLTREGVIAEIPRKLDERAGIIYGQVKPHVSGKVLDIGCGDGAVGKLLANGGLDVYLTDVYTNPNLDRTGLDFTEFKQGDSLPFPDNLFDTALVLTVYHHSDDPIKLIRESQRVLKHGGRLIVIESVYGVDGKELTRKERDDMHAYLNLTPEQQRRVNIFFDHFYNRIINYSTDLSKKVNIPFTFNTPEIWKEIFEENGLQQECVVHLGIDQPVVPEYHTLHVLRKGA